MLGWIGTERHVSVTWKPHQVFLLVTLCGVWPMKEEAANAPLPVLTASFTNMVFFNYSTARGQSLDQVLVRWPINLTIGYCIADIRITDDNRRSDFIRLWIGRR